MVRYFILSSHYRSPLNYSRENLDSAKAALDRFYTALRDVPVTGTPNIAMDASDYVVRFRAAMDDDFNTPEALAVLFDLVRDLNRAKSENKIDGAQALADLLRQLGGMLGILQSEPERWFKVTGTVNVTNANDAASISGVVGLSNDEIDALVEKRLAARMAKNWAESDRIRDELKAQGIILEDRPDGTTDWRRA